MTAYDDWKLASPPEADEARALLAAMPPDPDVDDHVVALCEGIA
jgi:hypothetical protein